MVSPVAGRYLGSGLALCAGCSCVRVEEARLLAIDTPGAQLPKLVIFV